MCSFQGSIIVFFLGKENLWCSQFVGIQITFCHFPTIEHHCSTFQKPKGVIMFPPTCGKQPAKPGTVCQLGCRQGFVLSGVRDEVRCTTSGKWSAKVQTAVCKGRSPPLVRLKTRLLYNDIRVQCRTVPLCSFYCKRMVNSRCSLNIPYEDFCLQMDLQNPIVICQATTENVEK